MTPEPRSAPTRPSARGSLPGWAAICFFASGAAGLLYEVVWSKQFAYLLGSSLHAVATVVAAFLCGLALGARLLGVPLARRGRGARDYAWLELGVGLLGVVSLPVLRGLEPLIGTFYRSLGGESPAFATVRFAILFVVLLPPTALMGATLPVLVAHCERGLVGPSLARLYALNTMGAVAGSLAGGFALLPGLGLTATTWVAAGLNAVVALVAWRAASAAAPEVAEVPTPRTAAPRGVAPVAARPAPRAAVAVLFAASGFAALVFQVAWVRLFTLVFGSSVYSFSAVLGIYLLGLALGSAAVARSMTRGVSLAGFARLQLLLAAVAALLLLTFRSLPEWAFALGERAGPHWGAMFGEQVGLVALLLIVPCALLGAVFPIATRLLQRTDGGDATGFAYAVNTAGTIAGTLVAGFYAIPALGVQGTHVAALALSATIGLAALAMARARGEAGTRDLGFAAAAVAGTVALVLVAPPWAPGIMSSGAYRPAQASRIARFAQLAGGTGSTVERAASTERVVFYREGLNGSVLVESDPSGSSYWLRVGGKVDASTDDMQTQVMLGLLPAVLADSGARTLVIGLGSGVTAASALAGGAGPTEVVELEPAVAEASRFFHAPGENPLEDPRVTLVLGDARTRLVNGAGRYGLIVSEPSNPWIAGVNNLFTVDFYRHVRARLEPGGVFCQWMQLYELSPETFGSMVASFLEVFPEGQVFSIWHSLDVLLVATPPTRSMSLTRLGSPAARRALARAKLSAPEAVAGFYAGPFAALRPAARGAALNRDDRPVVEYRAPRDLVEVGRAALSGLPVVAAQVPFSPARPAGPLFAAWPGDSWDEQRVALLLDQGQDARAGEMVSAAEAAGSPALAERLRGRIAARANRARSEEALQNATRLAGDGRNDEAVRVLESAVTIDPTHLRAWLLLADRRRVIGDYAGSEAALAHGRSSSDPDVRGDAEMLAGLLELARHRPREAAERFQAAQRENPRVASCYLLEERARDQAGDPAGALAALERGVRAIPEHPELKSHLAARQRGR